MRNKRKSLFHQILKFILIRILEFNAKWEKSWKIFQSLRFCLRFSRCAKFSHHLALLSKHFSSFTTDLNLPHICVKNSLRYVWNISSNFSTTMCLKSIYKLRQSIFLNHYFFLSLIPLFWHKSDINHFNWRYDSLRYRVMDDVLDINWIHLPRW